MIGKFGSVRLADALGPYLTETASLVPAFAALSKHESPPTGAEPLGGDALQAVVVHLLRALAAEKPTVWIVDDLHFAPQESRDLTCWRWRARSKVTVSCSWRHRGRALRWRTSAGWTTSGALPLGAVGRAGSRQAARRRFQE